VSGYVDKKYSFSLTRTITAATSFTSTSAVASSNVGGDPGVTISVYVVLGHYVPPAGALSVTFPSQYTISLLDTAASCIAVDSITNV
jgi:hypothetical protein